MVEFGLALALGSWLFFLVYPLYLYFGIAIKKEEALLTKYFGKAYTEYTKRVPRYL